MNKSIWTFYPTILRGVLLSIILFGVFSVVKYFIVPNTLVRFVIAVFISAVSGYVIGSFVVLNKKDRLSLINTVLKKVKLK